MGHQNGPNETDPAKIHPTIAEKIECKFLSHTHILTHTNTDICSFFDPESVCIREGLLGGLSKKIIFPVIS